MWKSCNRWPEFLKPADLSIDEFAFDAIGETEPGGHFFGSPHTLERYQTAFYEPVLSDWRNHETWLQDGERNATERATAAWQQALRDYEQPSVPEDRMEALRDYVERRRREIGDDEPSAPIDFP